MTKLASHIENVTVTADVDESDVLSPDPGEKVFGRQDLLDANPGRPGAPVSIPGYPIETASSGIKAPQYFAPGVAGDHGEPGDYRDVDVVMGLSPTPQSWVALSASYGNGFLNRLEHRQQYKFNGQRLFDVGAHRLTLFGIGYYGFSYIPGLVPISPLNSADSFPNYGDTIDPRQKDQTHTGLAALNDDWKLSGSQQLMLSGFFRTYNLSLFSNFGQGLISQSEFRTAAGASANYVNKVAEYLSLLGGFDYEREAPRRDNLDHYGSFNPDNPGYYGPFTPADLNSVTIRSLTPYGAVEGSVARYFRYYLGWRRDEINFNNDDLLHSDNSFQKWLGVNSPKATVSFLPKESWYVPLISLSFGQAFFTEDPRIGTGTVSGTPVATSHSYQLVASKTIFKTDVRLTLGHVTSSAELAKIDPDTGLQFDEGPRRLRFTTIAARRNFSRGSLLASFSKADARDIDTGMPTPEAPRTIVDLLGTIQKLPFRLQMRGEFEYVGAKPLGTGCLPNVIAECIGTPVKELRGAVVRPFMDGRLSAGVNFLFASGSTGQTTENSYASDVQEIVGVRIPSYASITFTYHFGHASAP